MLLQNSAMSTFMPSSSINITPSCSHKQPSLLGVKVTNDFRGLSPRSSQRKGNLYSTAMSFECRPRNMTPTDPRRGGSGLQKSKASANSCPNLACACTPDKERRNAIAVKASPSSNKNALDASSPTKIPKLLSARMTANTFKQ